MDTLSSIPAAIAVGGAVINRNWAFLDKVGAVVVSIFILNASWKIAKPALMELVDSGASGKELEHIKKIARSLPGVKEVHDVRSRYAGAGLHIDLHVQVDPTITIRQGHAIAASVNQRIIAEGFYVLDVIVHLEPFENS